MKKIVLIMAVFMLAAPALARVDIMCEQIGETNEVVVYYDAEPVGAVEPNLIRAFALDITLDTDANIVDVNDEVNPYYWVFPGSYPGGEARCDWEQYPGTLGEEPNQMTTEQGSLYADEDEEGHIDPPFMSDDLFTFRIDASSGTHQVTIVQNAIRGGIVSERIVAVPAYVPPTNLPTTCEVSLVACACCGDLNGDGLVQFADWIALAGLLNTVGAPYPPPRGPITITPEDVEHWNPCADVDGNGLMQFADWIAIAGWLNTDGEPYPPPRGPTTIVCPHAYGSCP